MLRNALGGFSESLPLGGERLFARTHILPNLLLPCRCRSIGGSQTSKIDREIAPFGCRFANWRAREPEKLLQVASSFDVFVGVFYCVKLILGSTRYSQSRNQCYQPIASAGVDLEVALCDSQKGVDFLQGCEQLTVQDVMAYGLYMSAAGANAQSHRLEVLSNNLANINTAGFKPHLSILQSRHNQAILSGETLPGSGELKDVV